MPYDYSDAPPPRDLELIPSNTIATLILHIQGGGAGEDGMLKRSKDGRCEMLDIEFVVVDGEYAKRKFWENWIVEGMPITPRPSRSAAAGSGPSSIQRLGLRPERHQPAGARRSHQELQGARGPDLHRQDRHREGHAEERRLGRELARQEHHRGDHHARPEGVAPGRAAAALQRRRPGTTWISCAVRRGAVNVHAAHRSPGMGVMKRASRTIGQVSLSALEDEWQRRATAAAIAGARGVVQADGPIPPGTPDRTTLGYRMGMGRRRCPVRLDQDACRAGGQPNSSIPSAPSA